MARGLVRINDRQKLRWLFEFGFVSLVPIVVLGLAVAQSLRASIRDRALDRAQQEAVVVSKLALEPQLSANDYANRVDSATRYRSDQSVTDGGLSRRIKDVIVRNESGRVVYSTNRKLIGRTLPATIDTKAARVG